MSTLQDIENAASTIGLNTLGLTAPLLAIRWSADSSGSGPASDPTEGASGTLNLGISSGDQWVAPAAGVLRAPITSFYRVYPDAPHVSNV